MERTRDEVEKIYDTLIVDVTLQAMAQIKLGGDAKRSDIQVDSKLGRVVFAYGKSMPMRVREKTSTFEGFAYRGMSIAGDVDAGPIVMALALGAGGNVRKNWGGRGRPVEVDDLRKHGASFYTRPVLTIADVRIDNPGHRVLQRLMGSLQQTLMLWEVMSSEKGTRTVISGVLVGEFINQAFNNVLNTTYNWVYVGRAAPYTESAAATEALANVARMDDEIARHKQGPASIMDKVMNLFTSSPQVDNDAVKRAQAEHAKYVSEAENASVAKHIIKIPSKLHPAHYLPRGDRSLDGALSTGMGRMHSMWITPFHAFSLRLAMTSFAPFMVSASGDKPAGKGVRARRDFALRAQKRARELRTTVTERMRLFALDVCSTICPMRPFHKSSIFGRHELQMSPDVASMSFGFAVRPLVAAVGAATGDAILRTLNAIGQHCRRHGNMDTYDKAENDYMPWNVAWANYNVLHSAVGKRDDDYPLAAIVLYGRDLYASVMKTKNKPKVPDISRDFALSLFFSLLVDHCRTTYRPIVFDKEAADLCRNVHSPMAFMAHNTTLRTLAGDYRDLAPVRDFVRPVIQQISDDKYIWVPVPRTRTYSQHNGNVVFGARDVAEVPYDLGPTALSYGPGEPTASRTLVVRLPPIDPAWTSADAANDDESSEEEKGDQTRYGDRVLIGVAPYVPHDKENSDDDDMFYDVDEELDTA